MKVFDEFIKIIKKLRAPDGCPWDQKQTPASLTPHIIEEAYELVEAIEQKDDQHIKEELGDILLHIVMLSNMAEEQNQFTLSDVIESEKAKMILRHPHVFKDTKVNSIQEIWHNWEKIKQTEKSNNPEDSFFQNVPHNLPSLLQAEKIQKKLSRLGFEWDHISGPIEKLFEEITEFKEELLKKEALKKERLSSEEDHKTCLEEELGDILFSIVNIARMLDLNPEMALRKSNQKFCARIKKIENLLKKEKKKLTDLSFQEFDHYWEKVKIKPL